MNRTYLKIFLNLGIALAAVLFCIFLLPRLIFFFMPFVVGWVIAGIASPLVRFLEKTFKIQRKAGSIFVIILVIALVILGLYLAGARLVEEIGNFVQELPEMWVSVEEDLAGIAERLSALLRHMPKSLTVNFQNIAGDVEKYMGEAVSGLSAPTIEALSRFAMNLPTILIGIIMCLLSSYLFVADREYVSNLAEKVMPVAIIERWNMVKRGLKRAVGGYFKAQLKIELWMYLLLGIGFMVLKVRYAFLLAIGVAFLDLLPFFGTGTVLIPWAVVKFLDGDYRMVIGLLIIWGAGQLARQIIQPKIVGDSVGLAPIPTLVLLYIGYKLAGVVGMIIAVPIGIIVLNMYEEGVFATTIDSLKILYAGISNFRHLKEEDMVAVEIYRQEEKKRIARRRKKEKENESDSV